MIPILYYGNETQFTSNGIGRLTEIISCEVTEERNGIYEVEFTYPAEGRFYNLLVSMAEAYAVGARNSQGIIACIHDDKHDIQPFDIYGYSAPIDGIATFYAHHISYRLGGMILKPIHASSVAQLIASMATNSVGSDASNFTYWTDKVAVGNFDTLVPKRIRSLLGGEEGSILDIYGKGEYEFDKFNVKLYVNRGVNSGVTIRYGKNLVDATREMDNSDRYNAIAPYWIGNVFDDETGESVEEIVYLSGNGYVQGTNSTGIPVIVEMDLSAEFDEKPTAAQLQAKALQFLDDNMPWVPNNNITVDFVQLWQTTEYENVAALQRVSLCDTVSVYYPEIGIVASNQKVIKAVYDVLLERYSEMEIGDASTSLADSITDDIRAQYEADLEKAKRNAATYDMLQAAIDHATEMITGGLGGYVVFKMNANGQPEEILIMDTPDINTAVNVWRFNRNGLGHSHNGYNGPFSDVALTADGAINATMMTTGQLNANIIKAGILQDQAGKNYWNLATGEFQLQAYATTDYVDDAIEDIDVSSAVSTAVNDAINNYDTTWTQTKVFNKLTNNGQLQGIYMRDNNLYINASYILSGILKVGGYNNNNGVLQILDADNNIRGLFNKDGIDLNSTYIYLADGYRWYTWNVGSNAAPGYRKRVRITSQDGIFSILAVQVKDNAGQDMAEVNTEVLKLFSKGIGTAVMSGNKRIVIGINKAVSGGASAAENRDESFVLLTGNQNDTNALYVGKLNSIDQVYMYSTMVKIDAPIKLGEGYIFLVPGAMASQVSTRTTCSFNYSTTDPTYRTSSVGTVIMTITGGDTTSNRGITVEGYIIARGSKPRSIETDQFNDRLLFCYETPSPLFGDIGDGVIDEDGLAYIYLDPIFAQAIDTKAMYQVFLQKYGNGNCWVEERKPDYFIVKGTPGLKFGWEIKGKQFDHDGRRFQRTDDLEDVNNPVRDRDISYADAAADYIQNLYEERMHGEL